MRSALSIAAAKVLFRLGFVLALMIDCSDSSLLAQTSQPGQLQEYLRRLGLEDLAIQNLKDRLRQESDAAKRSGLARQLATQYTELIQSRTQVQLQLQDTAAADDESRNEIQGFRKALAELQKEFDELKHPRYSAALFAADYARDQAGFFDWATKKPGAPATSSLAQNLLSNQHSWQQIDDEVTERLKRLDRELERQVETPVMRREMDELLAIQSQLQYTGGWLHYYLSLVEPENRQQNLEFAEELFLELLQISRKDILDIEQIGQLELDVHWVGRSLTGLAGIATSLKQERRAEVLDQVLESSDVPPVVRTEARWWKFHGLILSDQWERAIPWVVRMLKRSQQQPGAVRPGFWLAVAGVAIREKELPAAEQLVFLAFQGLAREDRMGLVEAILKENDWQPPVDRFVGRWIQGYREFSQAEKGEIALYEKAKQTLEQALSLTEPNIERVDRAHIRYLLAWIAFRQNRMSDAEKGFRQSSTGLRVQAPGLSAKALWLRTMALAQLGVESSAYRRKQATALNELIRLFPASEFAEKARFELTRLSYINVDPEEAIERLRNIPSSSGNFRNAQFEVARLYHRMLMQPASTEKRREVFSQFEKFVEEFCGSELASDKQRIRVVTLLVDGLLQQESVPIRKADFWNQKAIGWASQLDEDSEEVMDTRFQTFRIAKLKTDLAAATREAEWFTEQNSANRDYQLAALIFLASQADRELASTTNTDRPKKIQSAIGRYTRLSRFLGDRSEVLSQSTNARVACARLAQLEMEQGEFQSALQRFQALDKALPNRIDYILPMAKIHEKNGQREQALVLWRRIAGGSRPGTQNWIESKYHIVQHLMSKDPAKARAVIKQTVRLSPKMDPAWQARFEKLAEKIEQLP